MGVYRNKILYQRQVSRLIFTLLSVAFLLLVFYTTSVYDLKKKKEALGLYDENSRIKRNTKLIASWNTYWGDPTFHFGNGYEPFQTNDCEYQDCYIIYDSYNDVIDQYDAVLFHAPELSVGSYPQKRSPFQRYVFFNMLSPLHYSIPSFFNDFFNTTMSYRLDSDIPIYRFSVYDVETEELVSPNDDAQWVEKIVTKENQLKSRNSLDSKWRPVAWIATDCDPNSAGMRKALELKEFLDLDIFGECGDIACPRGDSESCFEILEKEYYFYLSFEDSNCLDYFTEKMGTAMANYIVPLYFGVGEPEKFIPPYSYIDAREMTNKELVDRIQHLIQNPTEYIEYFWWKEFYKVVVGNQISSDNHFCRLCEMLHTVDLPSKTYEDFHYWWNMYDGLPVCQRNSKIVNN